MIPMTSSKTPCRKLVQHCLSLFAILLLLVSAATAFAAERSLESVLPAPSCAEGWVMDNKVTLFDKESLFDRINGESELYFPYGFEQLAYARYENKQDPKLAIDADVYKMGSLLDAFGIFASYRRKDDAEVSVGGQGTISSSQVFFYQDRYFVRLQVTGGLSASPDVFLACAKAIAKNLPQTSARPRELAPFQAAGVVKKSERYVASSLLGYDFFKKGMIADAVLKNEQVQVFVLTEPTREAARATFDLYRAYLSTAKTLVRVEDVKGRVSLEGVDPLYNKVVVEQAGRSVIGVVRVTDISAARQMIEQIQARVDAE